MKTHKSLDVWQVAVKLAEDVYGVTRRFPKDELFGLTTQMRRCAISIPSNVAEGAARQGDKEFIQFLYVAAGSASELDTQLKIAKRVAIGEPQDLERLQSEVERISMMLQGLIRSVRTGSARPRLA
jgi:four helix bundle protein